MRGLRKKERRVEKRNCQRLASARTLSLIHSLSLALSLSHTQSVTLHTDLGDLKIELFCDQVPKATEVWLGARGGKESQ